MDLARLGGAQPGRRHIDGDLFSKLYNSSSSNLYLRGPIRCKRALLLLLLPPSRQHGGWRKGVEQKVGFFSDPF